MWKRTALILLALTIVSLYIQGANASGSVTITAGTVLRTKYGQLTALTTKTYDSVSLFAGNGSIVFNVTGLEFANLVYNFQFKAYGNGTWNILFIGITPISVTGSGATLFYNGAQWMQFSLVSSGLLTVVYGVNAPPQTVLFRDDFLYANPQVELPWVIDTYQAQTVYPGQFTASGYLNMPATATSPIETVHVSNPAFAPNINLNSTLVKRKLTVALIPFTVSNANNIAGMKIGMTPLLTTGGYPGLTPQGSPYYDSGGTCGQDGNTSDGFGSVYLFISMQVNNPVATVCGDGVNNRNAHAMTSTDPTKYTVATIETASLYCTSGNLCTDHSYNLTAWVFFRVYQEDNTGAIIKGSDNNFNFTALALGAKQVTPFYQTSYTYLSQSNADSAAAKEFSKIDFVELQNYGSPVCLTAPAGQLCTRFPNIPAGLGAGLISDIAWLSFELGFGDAQLGAVVMFLLLSFGLSFIPLIFTKSFMAAGLGELLVVSFFVYAGFFPSWVIFIPILFGAVLVIMIVNRMTGGYGMRGGGGEQE